MDSEIGSLEKPGFFASVRSAVAGGKRDFTVGSLKRALFMLSIPMVLEMVMESLFAVVDVFYVSRIGINAVAIVGLTESVIMIIYAIAIGLSMSATALVARRAGEKRLDAAADAAVQALILALLISIPLSLAGIFYAGEILSLMGATTAVIEEGRRYMQIMLGSNCVIMLLFLNNAIFRGVGDASIAMRVLWLANLLNMLFGLVLIFGVGPIPALGVTGAAIATCLGRGIGVLYQLYWLTNGRSQVRLRLRDLALNQPLIFQLFKLSLGGMGQFLIQSASWIFLMRIVSPFGSAAVAGYTIAIRIVVFSLLPAWGLANAAATLVGQNLGASQPDRAEKSVWTACWFNMLFLTSVSVLFFVFAHPILGIFSQNPEVVQNGVACLRYLCLGYPFYAYGMVISQSFNGAGDTQTPTWMNLVCFWLVQLPLAYSLARPWKMGPAGVYIAGAISFSLLAVVSILVFRKGAWKAVKV